MITPSDIEKALRNTPQEYKTMHQMNLSNPLVAGCKLGAVFTHNGEYHIYVGVNGRNRRFPLIAVRVVDGSRRKMVASFFTNVRKASQEG
jgi:hypothetical protein